MNIREYKKEISAFAQGKIELVEVCIKNANEKCKFLQNIYSDQRYCFSKEFTDAAVIERQRFCDISNASHQLLAEMKKEKEK